MERVTIRLPERYVEWLQEQSGAEPIAPVGRDVFRAVVDGEGPYADRLDGDSDGPTPDEWADLVERVERLERHVDGPRQTAASDAHRDAGRETNRTGGGSRSHGVDGATGDVPDDSRDRRGDGVASDTSVGTGDGRHGTDDHGVGASDELVAEVLAADSSNAGMSDERAAAIAAAFDRMRAAGGEAKTGDVVEWSDLDLEDSTARKFLADVGRQVSHVEPPSKRGKRTWRWVGPSNGD